MFEICADPVVREHLLFRRVSNLLKLVVRVTAYFSGENTTFYSSVHRLIVKSKRQKRKLFTTMCVYACIIPRKRLSRNTALAKGVALR